MTDVNSIPDSISLRSWTALTAAGLGLAFLSFIPGMLVMDLVLPPGLTNMGSSAMPESLDPDALPAWLDPQTYASWYRMHLGYHVVALAAFGGIVGWFQSRRMRSYVPTLHWAGATAIGYAAILCFEIVERHVVVGPHGGSVEPLMISIGGSTLAGVAQWLVLRRHGVRASRWLVFWIVGVAAGVGLAVATIIGLEIVAGDAFSRLPAGLVSQALPWGLMLLILGSVTGAVGGATSARALNAALAAAKPSSLRNHEQGST